MRVLVTGAAGNLGAKVRRHLDGTGRFDVIAVDRDPTGDVQLVDLASSPDYWRAVLDGVDTVVHFAADARVDASWESLQANNIDAVINLFDACVEAGVRRVVFASSSTVMQGYIADDARITVDLPARPETLYSATKLMGERLARRVAATTDLSVICLRIGLHLPGGEADRHHLDAEKQSRWLSESDLGQGVERAIVCDTGLRFVVLFLISDNDGMRWDIGETKRVLGFEPETFTT